MTALLCLASIMMVSIGIEAPGEDSSLYFVHDGVSMRLAREVIKANGIDLAANLYYPESGRIRGGIVVLHGSAPGRKGDYSVYVDLFVKEEFAVLTYDKRGVGESGGDWIRSSLDDLADDANALLEHFRAKPELEGKPVGFWGVSQAGWVMTRAVAKSTSVKPDFLVAVTGGGARPLVAELSSHRAALARAGFDDDATWKEAEALIRRFYKYLADGEDRQGLLQHLARVEKEPWYKVVNLGRILPSEENRENWAWTGRYEPVEDIATIKCPVLVMVGGKDILAPPKETMEGWREGLTKAGNKNYRIELFEEAAHGLRVGHHSPDAAFADGYLDLLTSWLKDVAK